ncbi:hypothetical protein DQ04_13441000 [Trypanosoma grayi]|uniref:hypothetical protein n=1 Tax=Trypanosoma grayi TaxID=71804 RepID=UPI0004F49549|nr:hypothetical protein DQ04_13441000 [Trypanosoma grayi]KEG06536.1 hypothetical protein DQ04_13441000 [Trypanosoma grayi]
MRRQAVEQSCEIAMARDTSSSVGAVPPLPRHQQSGGRSPLSESLCPLADEEMMRQLRQRELAKEEELMDAQSRLREAERRIAEEVERRARTEEERRTALEESALLLRDAERRAEERIRHAREVAEQQAAEEVSRVRNASERQAAHAATLRAIEEEEKRAVLEAQLRAAERALKEAQLRADEEVRRTKAEAAAEAAMEAQRIALEAERRLQQHEAQQQQLQRQQVAERSDEAERRLRNIERQAREAIADAAEEARSIAADAQRRLEELEARHAEREAAVDAAKLSVQVAQQRMREFEELQHNALQRPPVSGQPVEIPAAPVAATTRAADLTQRQQEQQQGGGAPAVAAVHRDDGVVGVVCSSVIRAAIREAVDEIVKATKEAWQISEEAEQRLRLERRRLRRRQAERDRAEQELIEVENESVLWDELNTSTSYACASSRRTPVEANKSVETPLWDLPPQPRREKEDQEQHLPSSLPTERICPRCYRSDTTACAMCASRVCVYCGPAVAHSRCCEMQHLSAVNTRRRQLAEKQQQKKKEQKLQQQQRWQQLTDDEKVAGPSLRDAQNNAAAQRRRDTGTSPLAVQRKLLPDESSADERQVDGDGEEEEEEEEEEVMVVVDVAGRADSVSSAPEPKTERKRYEAFFVPLGSDAEPRRPKPPTPNNYVPGVFAATSKFPRPDRRSSPPVCRPRVHKQDASAAAAQSTQQQQQYRRTASAPRERPATFASKQKQQRQEHKQPFTASALPVKEPLMMGRFGSRSRGRAAERRHMQDPLAGYGRSSSPVYLGVDPPAWSGHVPRRSTRQYSPREPSIELDDELDYNTYDDPRGLGRTYYDGKPVQTLGLNYPPDDVAASGSRSFGQQKQQQQQHRVAAAARRDEGHVNVSRECVFAPTHHEVPGAVPPRQRPEPSLYDHQRYDDYNTRTTPTLQELDHRLRHLQQHRVFDRVDRRLPDEHCMRHHRHVNDDAVDYGRSTAGRPTSHRPAPCPHEPCITVHLYPRSGRPDARGEASRSKSRVPSCQRQCSRAGRRSTPRVVSPPWRTDYNSGPLRPPWNVEQPHTFLAKPYKRSLLPAEL